MLGAEVSSFRRSCEISWRATFAGLVAAKNYFHFLTGILPRFFYTRFLYLVVRVIVRVWR